MPSLKDISGEKFNHLTVIARAENQGKRVMWRCKCDCGGEIITRGDSLQTGHTVSCGCISSQRLAEHRYKHGKVGSRAYMTWQSMKDRCLNQNNENYYLYGGRGIKVCEGWMNFEGFFLDMGDPPQGHSIDRKDPDGNYCKENCRWASTYDQARTKRTNIVIEWGGQTRILADWSAHLGINVDTLYARIVRYKWGLERAFTRPVKKGRDK